jgi:diguanylate cyclase (GGDEF)-like protein
MGVSRGTDSHRTSLLTRFAVLSLVLVVVLGVVLGAVLRTTVQDRALDDAVRTAEVAAGIGIIPVLTAEDLTQDFVPLSDERVAELDAALSSALTRNGIVRLKVWNREHWLVYSDNEQLRTRWFPGNELLEGSFDGRVTSELTDLSAPEEFEERDFGELLAVYVPLHVDDGGTLNATDGEVVGAFEIYLPYAPIAAAIAADTRELYLALALGLGLLYVGLFQLVSRASRRIRRQADENHHQATHDLLTDLPNRRLLMQHLDAAVARDRAGSRATAVLLVDLDRFKELNDALGHVAGDQLLCDIGDRLARRLDDASMVARLGGDEFAVVFDDQALAVDQLHLGQRVLDALDQPFEIEGLRVDVAASVGVALAPHHADGAADLVRHADVAMYVAKRARSGVEVYDATDDVFDARRLELAAEVRRAIDEHELVAFFQPKVHIASGATVGAEALVRWQHPERGLLGPGEFMPVVESTELITPLTMSMLDMALAALSELPEANRDLKVAVNLAAGSLTDVTLPSQVADALVRHGVTADRLELEITETSLLGDPARVLRVLTALSDMGVTLAVDDFGTGYASLAYLTELPVDVVKIDQSFVRDLSDPHQMAVTRYSIELARTLGLETVAEGVEDPLTLDTLASLGCDLAQGYHFSRPLPLADFVDWLRPRPADVGTAGAEPSDDRSLV